MALITCPECGKEISDKVTACPHCGYPIVPEEVQSTASNSPQKVELVSVKLDSSKAKKVLIGAVIVVILISVCAFAAVMMSRQKQVAARAEYLDNLALARSTMLAGGAKAESLCNLTKSVWRNTIYEETDIETDRFTKTNGKFNEDFNDSISALFKDESTRKTVSDINANQEEVTEIMRKLQNPPDDLSACFETVESMYEVYSNFTGLAISPSGSLKTYAENFNTYDDNFMLYYNKLDTQIPKE